MSLATRCTACGTVFRVVQDQLKVSEGWVRCGRCNEVFNALEGLFDLDRESALGWTPSQRGALDSVPGHAQEPGTAPEEPAAPDEVDSGQEPASAAEPTSPDTEVDTRADSQPEIRQPADDDEDDEDASDEFAPRVAADGAAAAPANEGDGLAAGSAPAFLRHAERAARWQRPHVRLALAAAAVLLGLLLAGQAMVHQRDAIAARWPQTTPLLAKLCESAGCVIEPLRRLESLSVESSGLTQLEPSSLYRLQVSLRSRDPMPLMAPALDVTLTDSRGEVVARKVLGRADFGPTTPAYLAANGELTLVAVLDTGERRVTGYSVEIFYP
jgi:predicted Zn finger-like uncharacterized protein